MFHCISITNICILIKLQQKAWTHDQWHIYRDADKLSFNGDKCLNNTHLNLPWQCWHWSPTHPRSQTQDPFTHLPDRQFFSQVLDGEQSDISTRENITHSHKYLCMPCSLCLTRHSSGLSILFPAFMVQGCCCCYCWTEYQYLRAFLLVPRLFQL